MSIETQSAPDTGTDTFRAGGELDGDVSPTPAAPATAEAVLARLRRRDRPSYALWGMGPLVVAIVLWAVIMVFAPSVAPERMVERPVDEPREQVEP